MLILRWMTLNEMWNIEWTELFSTETSHLFEKVCSTIWMCLSVWTTSSLRLLGMRSIFRSLIYLMIRFEHNLFIFEHNIAVSSVKNIMFEIRDIIESVKCMNEIEFIRLIHESLRYYKYFIQCLVTQSMPIVGQFEHLFYRSTNI